MIVNSSKAINMIDAATASVGKVAERFAKSDLSKVERDMVNLSVQETSVQLATAIVRTEDEMLGTLIDLKA